MVYHAYWRAIYHLHCYITMLWFIMLTDVPYTLYIVMVYTAYRRATYPLHCYITMLWFIMFTDVPYTLYIVMVYTAYRRATYPLHCYITMLWFIMLTDVPYNLYIVILQCYGLSCLLTCHTPFPCQNTSTAFTKQAHHHVPTVLTMLKQFSKVHI